MPEITPNTFESVQEYNDYLNQLHGRYDTLQDRINEMKNIINQQQNLLNEVWNTTSDQNISIQDMPSAQQQYQHLRDICADLDLVLDEIPSLKITTQAERNNVNKLVETIFDAQFALDELLRNPEAAQIDLRKEEELIATALEKMVQNKDNFGKASMFVRKWWTTNFSVGTYNNTSENVRNISEMMFGYANKIKSWVDTL
jgi:chromosome segregation ATPase